MASSSRDASKFSLKGEEEEERAKRMKKKRGGGGGGGGVRHGGTRHSNVLTSLGTPYMACSSSSFSDWSSTSTDEKKLLSNKPALFLLEPHLSLAA